MTAPRITGIVNRWKETSTPYFAQTECFVQVRKPFWHEAAVQLTLRVAGLWVAWVGWQTLADCVTSLLWMRLVIGEQL